MCMRMRPRMLPRYFTYSICTAVRVNTTPYSSNVRLCLCSACMLHMTFFGYFITLYFKVYLQFCTCASVVHSAKEKQRRSKDVRHAKHKITPRTGHRVDIRKRVWLHTPHTHAPRAQSPAPRRASVHHSASPSQPVVSACQPMPPSAQRSFLVHFPFIFFISWYRRSR